MYKHNTSKQGVVVRLTERKLTSYSTDVNFIASQALARSQQRPEDSMEGDGGTNEVVNGDVMAALERQARAPQGFVPASSGPEGGSVPQQTRPTAIENPDALNVDLDDE